MFQINDLKGGFKLNNGIIMPYLGLGTWKSKNGKEVIDAVSFALRKGYRHIDTASIYQNEEGVGEGIRKSEIPREDIFLTSKLWNGDQGYDSTLAAFEASLKRLQTTYLDLYLVHWPVVGKYKETWRAMEKLYADGRVKSIGVSNFMQHHLEDLLDETKIIPMVNQMEFHPTLVQQNLVDFCKSNKIQYEAWSPLMKGGVNDVPLLHSLAKKHGKSPAQITLRWDLQKGVVTIPKSVQKERILENAAIFDFELSIEEIQQIDALDSNNRIGPDPDNFNF